MPLYELMGRTSVERTLLRVNASYRLGLGDVVIYIPGENPNDYIAEVVSLLSTYCSKSWADQAKCAQFSSLYQACLLKITEYNTWTTGGPPVMLVQDAVICIKTLRKNLQQVINAGDPNAVPSTPGAPPGTSGIPVWGWALIGAGAVAVVGTAIAVAS